MDKEQIIEIVKMYKDLLSKHINFEEIILFGSYAKETYSDDRIL